ncbi:1,4-alpha-glucan branching protein GlgB [Aquifex aeolicus]|uniref:1,4-alpha-glucan branching enzyme GlgB n=1 Tax=Aquifex aeolicus (strain VF5) TaxID=224324 RepID=GLGB_AQUAE|nr:1,4-alpha-glucan branching protein GlgB [Aquifex aeolicus]O66936.1 RecName: Full=1,4-alpha-glucan branching enzyme GlgB; AltName: Full=1,4-alpha-D-glucan:1,4-alpha-D-glucan 6-glucosyl-transferase; AltName: Full=Alpha-(1->4)-glucan branching enzyme; AltName: Full=Glycogen branching enzyme; Short=BE [Aquifex aeolicus VF5]AAC06895.1 1,4-alpha-glucan branching enzyme [Aquifex aeolicus VF5]
MKKFSLISDYDVYLFKEGTHTRLYDKLGSHVIELNGKRYTFFAVWAPHADYVSLIGDFNEWDKGSTPMVKREDGSGIWEVLLEGDLTGSKYKYFIKNGNYEVDKSDPFAFFCEQPPGNASVVWKLNYRWNDSEYMKKRKRVNSHDSPISIYEVHVGSWRRVPEEGNRFLSYRELAEYLPYYVKEMGFTHVEFLPVMEHPFYGSWGYQITGYFAPTSRYGTPQDFMYLIDKLHQEGIGVILDWVPSHFPTDAHGLAYFDGTHLYEYEDWRKRWHPDWNSFVFDYGKPEVRSFLLSSAHFWLDKYHADGLRVDAVASMLYLDYSRKEWVPNIYGGKENLEAIEFLRKFNESVYRNFPDVQTIAEESTAWPMVSRPTYVGGLGFGMKWNMGWMNDTLFYFSKDPIYRKYHHEVLTFSIWYAFSENFVLPLSHDEVVHGKGSLIGKMPGDYWQKFANLRALFGYMWAHPGKKLLFMGGEFGQFKEWDHETSLDWHLLEYPSHRGIQRLVKDLNEVYRREKALHETDFSPEGFEWVDFHDWEKSVISFLRKDKSGKEIILVVCNFTPVPRYDYRVGVPKGGYWREIMNTDAKEYWGSGMGNLGGKEADKIPWHGRKFSLSLTLPPLSVIYLKHEG